MHPSSLLPDAVCSAAHRFYTAHTIITVRTELGVEEKYTPPLQSVTNPEEKRAIIGNTFMRVRLAFLPCGVVMAVTAGS